MPTDTEIWDAACERVGLWKRGQRCNGFQRPSDNDTKVCVDCGATKLWYGSHTIPAPAIDDSDAAMKMIAWALKHQLTVCIGPRWVILHNDRGSNVGEGDNFDNDSSRTTPLALANAVLAVPQETQP